MNDLSKEEIINRFSSFLKDGSCDYTNNFKAQIDLLLDQQAKKLKDEITEYCFEVARLTVENKELKLQAKKEAIAFKEWCDSGKEWFFDNSEEHTHTIEQLYNLYIQSKQQ